MDKFPDTFTPLPKPLHSIEALLSNIRLKIYNHIEDIFTQPPYIFSFDGDCIKCSNILYRELTGLGWIVQIEEYDDHHILTVSSEKNKWAHIPSGLNLI